MDHDQQIQTIILRLTGVPELSLPQSFQLDVPWRNIFQQVRPVHSRAEALQLLTEAAGPDGEGLVAELRARLPGDSAFSAPSALRREARSRDAADDTAARFPSLRDIPDDTASVSWLWPSWIPCGMVTLFAAVPGMGKSLVTLDLARRVIAGEPFPDGAPAAAPGRPVVLVDAEAAPGLLRQRAAAWQIDAGLIYPMAAHSPGRPIDLSTPFDIRRLVELLRQGPPRPGHRRLPRLRRPAHRDQRQSRPPRPQYPRLPGTGAQECNAGDPPPAQAARSGRRLATAHRPPTSAAPRTS